MERHQRGDLATAEALYRAILAAVPHCIDALHFLGLAATQRGDLNEGITHLRRAVELNPAAAAIQCNLARALIDNRESAAAIAACNIAIALEPANANAWFFRGNALQLADAHEQALHSYDQALRHTPGFVAALNNKAHSLRMLRRSAAALEALAAALALQPTYALALNNQGLALLDLNRGADALRSFEMAVAAAPNFAEAMSNRGTALVALKRHAEAGKAFKQLAAQVPGFGAAMGNLMFARRHCCDWDGLEALGDDIIAAVLRGEIADLPLSFLYTSESPTTQLACARAFSGLRYPARPMLGTAPRPHTHPRIRVAYLSGDFGEHAVSYLLAGVIERHDPARFETIGIGWGRQNQDPVRRRIEAAFGKFEDATHLSDTQIAALLQELEVDIAVDLMGHTSGQRTGVFAYRGAPLQVSFLGYPGTSGAPYMDYLIGDRVVIPQGEEHAYSEQVVRLPHCYLPTDDRRVIAESSLTRDDAGLPAAGFVFCAFNSPAKFTRTMFQIWLRLLHQVPGSVLWLRTSTLEVRANLQREARIFGLEEERLVFADSVESIESHLARHRLADLFLDTLPYNAHSTACDALWAGLPVLTCRGAAFAGRVGASLLQAVGLPELIAATLEEYESKALELAREPTHLAAIRARLAQLRKTSPLFDTGGYVHHLEAAYESMCTRQRQGRTPASFSVDT